MLHEGALAADAAYQVDTADVATPGSAKVETWVSFSEKDDIIAAVNPAFVADVSRPLQVNVQLARLRSDGEYASTATPRLKTNLLPTGIGTIGLAVAGGVTYDADANNVVSGTIYVPATYRLSHRTRVNVNLGWLRDRVNGADHATYGLGMDVRTSDNVWTLTGELFGQAVKPAPPGENQPRYQLGVRWRPVDPYSVDLVYGHNLIGEGRNWLTIAAVVRFR